MNRLQVLHIRSVDELRASASAWDDLWRRSGVTMPTARAELLAQWVEQFSPAARLHALVVEDRGKWVGALPLVPRRVAGLFSAGSLPTNQWSTGGQLLLDAAGAVDDVVEALVEALGGLPWQLLWLDEVALDAPCWQAFQTACDGAELANERHERFDVGLLEIDHDWQAYRQRWSRSHRQRMAKTERRLARKGNVRFRRHSSLEVSQVDAWMRRAFEVEDLSWKGNAGTSVLRTPGMFSFFVRQAEQLARWGQLEIATLELDERLLAFNYGFSAKGVYHAHKIGYDPQYAAFSPGQLLFYYLIETLHGDAECRALDFMGPLTGATAHWKPAAYRVGRVVLAPRRLPGRLALYAYKHWWPYVGGLCFGRKRRSRAQKQSGPAANAPPERNEEASELVGAAG